MQVPQRCVRVRSFLLSIFGAVILSSCGGSGSSGGIAAPPVTYPVSVTVSGLSASASVSVLDNGKDSLTFNSNTTQPFATQLAANAMYAVTVSVQPANEICTVSGGSGTVTGATTVTLSCALAPPSTHYPAFLPPYPDVLSGPIVIPHPVVIPVFFSDVQDQAATVTFLQTLIA